MEKNQRFPATASANAWQLLITILVCALDTLEGFALVKGAKECPPFKGSWVQRGQWVKPDDTAEGGEGGRNLKLDMVNGAHATKTVGSALEGL